MENQEILINEVFNIPPKLRRPLFSWRFDYFVKLRVSLSDVFRVISAAVWGTHVLVILEKKHRWI